MLCNSTAFKILLAIGCWYPAKVTNRIIRYLNYFYIVFIYINCFLIYFFQTIYLIINIKINITSTIDNLVINSIILFTFSKCISLLINRKKFLLLHSKLRDTLMNPNSNEEILIEQNCEKNLKLITLTYLILSESCSVCMSLLGIVEKKHKLPSNTWLPFEVNQSNFWMIYIWQSWVLILGAAAASSTDCVFLNCIKRVCAKIKILSC